jgi:uncharacterized membrane protein YqjE
MEVAVVVVWAFRPRMRHRRMRRVVVVVVWVVAVVAVPAAWRALEGPKTVLIIPAEEDINNNMDTIQMLI